MPEIETVEVETAPNPVGSVIWLHGLGADGHDFEPVVAELRLPETLPLRFVFPHAPPRPVTINGGMAMRAWYDITSLDREGPVDEAGIAASSAMLDALIERERSRGIDACDVLVAGFSQGGVVALYNALHASHEPRGLMALSCYLPPLTAAEASGSQRHAALRVFMAHGTLDPMVPCQAGVQAADKLRALGYAVEWHDYPMAHGVCQQEIADIRAWLLETFAVSGQA